MFVGWLICAISHCSHQWLDCTVVFAVVFVVLWLCCFTDDFPLYVVTVSIYMNRSTLLIVYKFEL